MSKAAFWLRSVLVIGASGLISACGDAENGAPAGSTVTINPATYTLTNPYPDSDCGWDDPVFFRVTVLDIAGNPLNDIGITIVSEPFYSRLFLDTNNNKVPDPEETATPLPSTYLTTTGAFGSKNIFISSLFGGTACMDSLTQSPPGTNTSGLKYSMDLVVYTGGTTSGKAVINVQ